jgi:glycosyltransferase involved in cell wall biosynthesis
MFDVTMALEAQRLDSDLYICNDMDTLPVGAFMGLLGRRVVYDAHELYPDLFGETPPYVRMLLRQMESFLIGFTDLVITVNEFIASEMSSRYGITSPTVVMNCPKGPIEISRVLSERRDKTALYHGVLTRERGLENVVLACKYLREGIRVVFRGEGPIEGTLKELARSLRNCTFEEPVPVDEVISKAAEADVGIVAYLPTTLNNLYASPNKLFEYLQAGLPVMGSNIPFIRQILTENEVGFVFDPYDPSDIARVTNLITQEEVHERLKRNVENVKGRFSWEAESQKFLCAISALLSAE